MKHALYLKPYGHFRVTLSRNNDLAVHDVDEGGWEHRIDSDGNLYARKTLCPHAADKKQINKRALCACIGCTQQVITGVLKTPPPPPPCDPIHVPFEGLEKPVSLRYVTAVCTVVISISPLEEEGAGGVLYMKTTFDFNI